MVRFVSILLKFNPLPFEVELIWMENMIRRTIKSVA